MDIRTHYYGDDCPNGHYEDEQQRLQMSSKYDGVPVVDHHKELVNTLIATIAALQEINRHETSIKYGNGCKQCAMMVSFIMTGYSIKEAQMLACRTVKDAWAAIDKGRAAVLKYNGMEM